MISKIKLVIMAILVMAKASASSFQMFPEHDRSRRHSVGEEMTLDEMQHNILGLNSDGRWGAIVLTLLVQQLQMRFPIIMRNLGVIVCEGSGTAIAPLIASRTPTRDILVFLANVPSVRRGPRYTDSVRNFFSIMRGAVESLSENYGGYNVEVLKTIAHYDPLHFRVVDLRFISARYYGENQPIPVRMIDGSQIYPEFTLENMMDAISGYDRHRRETSEKAAHQELTNTFQGIATGATSGRTAVPGKEVTMSNVVRQIPKIIDPDKAVLFLNLRVKVDNNVTSRPIVSCCSNSSEASNGKTVVVANFRLSLPSAYADHRYSLKAVHDAKESIQKLFSRPNEAISVLDEINMRIGSIGEWILD
jgi:hypothetical protein